MKKTIYYHDTDCGGVVYYANYLKYMEEARTEFFRERGFVLRELAQSGVLFVIARQEIDYKRPAVYGDELEITSRIIEQSAVKLIFEHEVRNQQKALICIGKAVLVCVDKDIHPRPLPDEVREKVSV